MTRFLERLRGPRPALLVLAVLLLGLPVTRSFAQTEEAGESLGWSADAEHLWKRYMQHMDSVLEHVIELDLWGISTPQLPEGIWKIKLRTNHQKAVEKYDGNGNIVPIAPSLVFPDLFDPTGERNVFFVDLQGQNGGGVGYGYTIQISYGITDTLNWYIELPFQSALVQFDVQYQPGNLPDWEWGVYKTLLRGIDLRTEDGFWQFVEAMGRRLKLSYQTSGLDLGDIHGGLSWNYYKGKYFAAATTGRVYLPTGFQPSADNDIELFSGTGFPAGTRAWGLSTTQGFDFRLPDPLSWIVCNTEFTYEYRFKTRRDAPTSASFPKRTPYFEALYNLLTEAEPEIAMLFPDLSNMGDYYYITYGSSFDGEVGIILNPFLIAPIGVKYAGGWSQEPTIDSSSKEFVQYVKQVEIVGEQVKHVLAVGGSVSLLPIYVPLNLTFEYQFPLGGKGAFVIDENWAVTAELFLAF